MFSVIPKDCIEYWHLNVKIKTIFINNKFEYKYDSKNFRSLADEMLKTKMFIVPVVEQQNHKN